MNVTMFIGLVILILLPWVFHKLARGGLGCAYFVSVVVLAWFGKFGGEVILGLLGFLIYIVSWVHANAILSKYERLAKERIAEIDRGGGDVDGQLEKALLTHKVLDAQST